MCPGVDSASKNKYQDTPGGEGGRCLRLTTFVVPNVMKIRGLNLPDPLGSSSGLYQDKFLLCVIIENARNITN
jgi:hypothetical protein